MAARAPNSRRRRVELPGMSIRTKAAFQQSGAALVVLLALLLLVSAAILLEHLNDEASASTVSDPKSLAALADAKAALIAHAKKLAIMHAPSRIRVNAIAPGSTEFPGGIWSTIKEHQPEVYESVRASIPWGRLGTPAEVANLAVFLVSPRASWVVGECVAVDGGQHRGMR